MSHQVCWTKRVESFFVDAANLTPFEAEILHGRVCGMTIKEMAYFYSCSESTISKCIALLKKKYDIVQKEYPDELRPRRASAAETYMDNN